MTYRSVAQKAKANHAVWFAGLTWNGWGIVGLLCVINAARRTSRDLDRDIPPGETIEFAVDWLLKTLQGAASGLIVAVPVALAIVATYNLAPRKPWVRNLALAVAVASSCAVGVALMAAVEAGFSLSFLEDQSLLNPLAVGLVRYGLLSSLVALMFVYLRAADESSMRAQEAERDRERFEQRMEEARLKMLQAQIEPHFLFNALANVRGLHEDAPALAERMLDNLVRYFAAALPQMRNAHATLGQEAAMATAYLEIQAIRMGRRLEFEVDIPLRLYDVPFPSLMLLTLVENAIKHGLAPLSEGGTLRVSATNEDGMLRLCDADSGVGFVQTSGGGTGLANIRARLAALHGNTATLKLSRNTPRGVVAIIDVPLALDVVVTAA
jgi:sensor histidine kinase YesM